MRIPNIIHTIGTGVAVFAAALVDCRAAGGAEPLRVFVLAGQSNMQGHAHVDTFDAMALDEDTAAILTEMRDATGDLRVCDRVWISSIGSADEEQTGRLTAGFGAAARGPKIGPEFTFGIQLEKQLEGPILLIKTAWGGRSLHTDFRPPGAGPYVFNEQQLAALERQGADLEEARAERAESTGVSYRLMIDHVERVLGDIERVCPGYDPVQGYELSGFVWFQGWNDMVDGSTYPKRGEPGGYDEYSRLLAQFIRDVRKDLDAPELPFVIGVMGVGGPTDQYGADQLRYQAIHQSFRDAMAAPAALPEFRGNVATVLTEEYWDMELVALREREKPIRERQAEIEEKVKAGEMTAEDGRAAVEELYAATFSPRELELLRTSVSNLEFHYLGSARIMGRIGKAFAEAMVGLLE